MLTLRHLLLAGVTLLSLTPVVAGAAGDIAKPQRWQTLTGGWMVEYYPNSNQCILGRNYDDGTAIQAFRLPKFGWSMRLINGKWSSIVADQHYNVRLWMDGGANRWSSNEWIGVWNNAGDPGVFITGLSVDFMWSFMKRSTVEIYNGDKYMTGLHLDGSFAGMSALLDCERANGPAVLPNTPEQQRSRPKQQEQWS